MPILRQALPYAVMLAVSAGLYWAATRIEPGTGGRIGPGVWPKAIVVFMALLCLYEIVKRLARRGEARAAAEEIPRAHRMLWWGIGLIVAYVLLVPWVGFFAGTLLFLWSFQVAGGFRRHALAGFIALIGTMFLVLVFMRIAYISLPLGEGPFKVLSIGVMKLIGAS